MREILRETEVPVLGRAELKRGLMGLLMAKGSRHEKVGWTDKDGWRNVLIH